MQWSIDIWGCVRPPAFRRRPIDLRSMSDHVVGDTLADLYAGFVCRDSDTFTLV